MTIFKRIVLFVGLFIAAFLLYHRDVITGYWKFRALCKKDGGVKIHEPLQGNVGWMLAEPYKSQGRPAAFPFRFRQKFIRYEGHDGNKFDVIKVLPPLPHGVFVKNYYPYIITLENKEETILYLYKNLSEFDYLGDKRFQKYQRLIIDIKTQKIVAEHTWFSFAWTTPDRIILSPPSASRGCGVFPHFPSYQDFYTAVNSTME